MTAKEVRFGTDVRDRMLKRISALANAVKISLGPKGRNVILGGSQARDRQSRRCGRGRDQDYVPTGW